MKVKYKRTNYPSDLADGQWEKIAGFFPLGNKSKYHKRNLVEAVVYVAKTGCQWRVLPHDYPPYSTVYHFYSRAKQKGIWEKVMQFLVKETRINSGKDADPSYALIDSQSVKTAYAVIKRGMTEGKNERDKKAYRNRYYGKYSCSECSQSKSA